MLHKLCDEDQSPLRKGGNLVSYNGDKKTLYVFVKKKTLYVNSKS